MAKSNKGNKASKQIKIKKGVMTKVEGVRVSRENPTAAVKFKITKADKDTGNMTVRASSRGNPRIYVRVNGETGKAMAGVRGEAPVAAKTPGQAFAKAVRRDWA